MESPIRVPFPALDIPSAYFPVSTPPEYYRGLENERTSRILSLLSRISGETGKTMAQVALNWVISNPAVTAPIIGARNVKQLEDNLGSVGWRLTEEQMSEINGTSIIEVTYPYDQRSEDQQQRERILA